MMSNPINVFLIDDEFPPRQEFVNRGVFETGISSEDLFILSVSESWGSLHFLQELIKNIVVSSPSKNGLINLTGFKSPSIALDSIDAGLIPDVVIYDWEYGMPNPTESQQLLLEILEATETTFVFIYSKVRDDIPQFINIRAFDPYAKRLQLFLKGSTSHSIFSSEDFILQYILGRVTDDVNIKIQGYDVEFTPNAFLQKASDILYLERIVGKLYLLEELKKIQFTINNYTVENLLNDTNGTLYYSEGKGLLVSPDEKAIIGSISDLKEIGFAVAAKEFSISKLEEALIKGTALI